MRARFWRRRDREIALGLFLGFWLCCGCTTAGPSKIEIKPEAMIVVQSAALPDSTPFYAQFAHHSWIDIKPRDWDQWIRLEVERYTGVEVKLIEFKKFASDERFDNNTSVLAIYRGDAAEALLTPILAETHRQSKFEDHFPFDENDLSGFVSAYGQGFFSYRPWIRNYDSIPGPNSNTFIASLIDAVPGFSVELDHNAVGKDYPDRFRIGTTSAGHGFEIDSPYLGLGIGLKQGIELHLIGLTVGVSIWPPAIKIPILPRIGISPGWLFFDELPAVSTGIIPSER